MCDRYVDVFLTAVICGLRCGWSRWGKSGEHVVDGSLNDGVWNVLRVIIVGLVHLAHTLCKTEGSRALTARTRMNRCH